MKRILCIDGGGIKGTQSAAFLTGLEEDLDQPFGRYFDLIAGTSTGGILVIDLAQSPVDNCLAS
ncbi:MAG: patatin-like phospholipase family protein [Rhodobacteraceae bacterium]|nr:patatin-like phospholipase family protein [Paracoccaceae bacterium]MCY4196208.1 patatin-like phospholipase family protein [Paracoccaceae bacterium]